jgi:hypothetical protein
MYVGPVTFGRLKGFTGHLVLLKLNCCFTYRDNDFQKRTDKFAIIFTSDKFRIERSISRVKTGTITRSIACLWHEILSFRFRTYINKLLLLLLSLISPLWKAFTITRQKQTMFLGYTVLQLFCIYNFCYM